MLEGLAVEVVCQDFDRALLSEDLGRALSLDVSARVHGDGGRAALTRATSASTRGRSFGSLIRVRKYCSNFARREPIGTRAAWPGSSVAVSSTRSVGKPSLTSLVLTRAAAWYSLNTAISTALMSLLLGTSK
jgi:hypothetical protein